MCGFFAVFRLSEYQIPEAAFISAANQILSRGGTSKIIFGLDRQFALFHTRLIVCGDNLAGAQPQITPNGRYGILYNGEIYNYRELAKELNLKAISDTDVLVRGVDHFGEIFLERLSGIFAITIIDFEANRLILRRDGLGIKPLYHYKTDEYLAVTSTPKAIYEYSNCTSLDKNALVTWLELGSDFFGDGLTMGLGQSSPGLTECINLETGEFESEKLPPSEALQRSLLRFDSRQQKESKISALLKAYQIP